MAANYILAGSVDFLKVRGLYEAVNLAQQSAVFCPCGDGA
jgi:hypothetical protein